MSKTEWHKIIENDYGKEQYELHEALKHLDASLHRRSKQEAAIFYQSIYLIEDAARLYEENDRLRKAAMDAWGLFVRYGGVHPCDLPRVDDVRERLEELGIEVHQ